MSFDSPASDRTIYRSIFMSDIHLGTRGSRAVLAADFLKSVTCEKLYLVGDIIDGWRLRRSWFWDEAHDELLRLILNLARRGTEVIYIPGNHDEIFRRWLPMELKIASVRLCARAEHVAADGRKYLVMHGDEFDSVVRCAPILAILGDHAYTFALFLNRWINVVRRKLGLPYRSFSKWAKKRVKGAVKAIDRFEHALAREARQHGADGVICGHIHHAEIREIDGMTYMNSGDWVESCTALVEDAQGHFSLVEWTSLMRSSWSEGGRWFHQAPSPSDPAQVPALVMATASPDETRETPIPAWPLLSKR
ncbi:UDP-2,3-diacylglucosamine diphosphatase [Tanticharoenia sakaeratensis]|uniref:Metallophosphoesterase n=1 Tax=Tanticharoenia sakaeratensis NBRC 103193 TaxID=1231623 RepID=A0A0D6MP27_9PROT|nr:UDP-2,3-diacylglucosamine diphosphatase [Tanticharoenia sakaeratensis]GAN55437.1 metallophosphoesterase [Tanticharoenia sakaeratensis NBRC 103193]GBQ22071.1 metallophosphoesterase [Tanticharoenia sakaeratensis NBRC 103193]